MQIELHFHDISKLKPHFTEEKLRKLVKEKDVYSKTANLSAIVTDGTSILGYGNIGPMAGLPVMEGKSLLFKLLGDVEVVPACIHPRKEMKD
jgi:malic enzyme